MKKKQGIKKLLWELLDWSRVILTAVLMAYIISSTLIANAQVPTGSMEDTVMTGSRIIVNRLSYAIQEPERGDIIAFYPPGEEKTIYLKRIIGLPGETIEGIEGKVYIDGVWLEENYIGEGDKESFGPFVIPGDAYFVMGDNRSNSWDARYWDEKFIRKEAMIGRAEFEYYPELKRLN